MSDDFRRSLVLCLAICGAYLLVAVLLLTPVTTLSLSREDSFWIRGQILGSPARLTAHFLLHRILLPLVGGHLVGYRLCGVVIHLLNTVLVCGLFWLFFKNIQNPLRESRSMVCLGAATAGIFFLVSDTRTYEMVNALPYELVTFFTLWMLIFSCLYWQAGRLVFWLLSAAAYVLALFSHSFAMALPAVVLLMEVCWRRCCPHHQERPYLLLRYGGLVALLAGFLFFYFSQHAVKGLSLLQVHPHDGQLIFLFPRYVFLSVLPLFKGLLSPNSSIFYTDVITLGLSALITAAGLRQILGRKRALGLPGVGFLFLVAWVGMTLIQAVAIEFQKDSFRYYLNTVGVAISAAFFLAWMVGRVWVSPARRLGLPFLVVVLVTAALVLANEHHQQNIKKTLMGELDWGALRPWSRDPRCEASRTISADEFWSRATGEGLRCATLRYLDLSGVDLRERDLFSADMTGAHFTASKLQGLSAPGAAFLWANLRAARLDEARLPGADFRGADLSGAVLERADLNNADLHWASADRANLRFARLARARLRDAEMQHADFQGADLRGADLSLSDLRYSNLRGAQLTGANLDGVALQGVQYDATTTWPEGFDPTPRCAAR